MKRATPSVVKDLWLPRSLGVAILIASGLPAPAQVPGWWTNRAVLTTNEAQDFAVVNQGQLKWLATEAVAELGNSVSNFGVRGSNLLALVSTFSPTNNYLPVNQGQLKHTASQFYSFLNGELGAGIVPPWTLDTLDDNDFAVANAGQVKALFSFDPARNWQLAGFTTNGFNADAEWIVDLLFAPISGEQRPAGVIGQARIPAGAWTRGWDRFFLSARPSEPAGWGWETGDLALRFPDVPTNLAFALNDSLDISDLVYDGHNTVELYHAVAGTVGLYDPVYLIHWRPRPVVDFVAGTGFSSNLVEIPVAWTLPLSPVIPARPPSGSGSRVYVATVAGEGVMTQPAPMELTGSWSEVLHGPLKITAGGVPGTGAVIACKGSTAGGEPLTPPLPVRVSAFEMFLDIYGTGMNPDYGCPYQATSNWCGCANGYQLLTSGQVCLWPEPWFNSTLTGLLRVAVSDGTTNLVVTNAAFHAGDVFFNFDIPDSLWLADRLEGSADWMPLGFTSTNPLVRAGTTNEQYCSEYAPLVSHMRIYANEADPWRDTNEFPTNGSRTFATCYLGDPAYSTNHYDKLVQVRIESPEEQTVVLPVPFPYSAHFPGTNLVPVQVSLACATNPTVTTTIPAGMVTLVATHSNGYKGAVINVSNCEASVRLDSYVDIDVDSDNADGFAVPDWRGQEGLDETNGTGKILAVNHGDADGDGIPDFADGFNWEGRGSNYVTCTNAPSFVPLSIKLPSPNIANVADARLYFSYSESNPTGMVYADGQWTLPEGHIRLWTTNSQDRQSVANLITNGGYDASHFAWDTTNRTVIFIEGVQAGSNTIRVSMGPVGYTNHPWVDEVGVTVLKVELFRNEACTKSLDDWPENGAQLRSPKYLFGKESNVYVRVVGPGGLGDDHFTVKVTSESDTTGLHLHLHEVSSGVYRNCDASGSELLRLDESTHVGTGNDVYIKVLDEEVLTFSLKVAGEETGCDSEVMVDRGEYAMGTQKPEHPYGFWHDVAEDFEDPLDSDFRWWANGDQNGPSEDYVRKAADASHSQSDIFSLAGHGLPESTDPGGYARIKLNGSDYEETDDGYGISPHERDDDGTYSGYRYDGSTWQLNGGVFLDKITGGIEYHWKDDVEWVIVSSCQLLRNDMPASPTAGDWVYNKDVWDDTLFGERPAHGLFGYSGSPQIGDLDEVVTEFFNEIKDGEALVDAWKVAVIAETWTDYGIVMHADNAGDKLTEPTADTMSSSMRYWYSTGQSHQSPIDYQNVAGGGIARSTERVTVRLAFTPSEIVPTAKRLLARVGAISLPGQRIDKRGDPAFHCLRLRRERTPAGRSEAIADVARAVHPDFSVKVNEADLWVQGFDENASRRGLPEREGTLQEYQFTNPAFPVARNRRGNFLKVVSLEGRPAVIIARLMRPQRFEPGTHSVISQREAVERVRAMVTNAGSARIGASCDILSAELEYEDRGARTAEGDLLLDPTWKCRVKTQDGEHLIYIPATEAGK